MGHTRLLLPPSQKKPQSYLDLNPGLGLFLYGGSILWDGGNTNYNLLLLRIKLEFLFYTYTVCMAPGWYTSDFTIP